jgi:ligand-binding sensor domain-containing protein/two-component sensor histidine kinase
VSIGAPYNTDASPSYVNEWSKGGGEPALARRSLPCLELVLLVCMLAWFGCGPGRALNPHKSLNDYSRQMWSTDNGLPQNSVHSILQTSDGFLWLGTEGGLARFDGYQFRVFDRQSTPALPGDDIRCLLEDKSGALWVGTASGLARLKDDRAQTFSGGSGLPAGAVRSLLETDDGRLWVLSANGLAVADIAKVNPARISFHTFSQADGMSTSTVLSMAKDANGGLWVGTSDGLDRIVSDHVERGPAALAGIRIDLLGNEETDARALLIATPDSLMQLEDETLTSMTSRDLLPTGGIRSLLATSSGIWAVGRDSATLIRHDKTVTFAAGHNLPGTQITTIAEDRNGAVWIGTNAGLARFWNGRMESAPGSAPTDSAAVLAIYEDRDGDLWVGTETAGVRVLRDRMFQVVRGSPDPMESPVTSVLQTPDGNLWIGTNGAGVTGIRQNETQTFTSKDGLTSDTILALASGHSNSSDLWVGTPDGLNVLRAGRWKSLTSADGLADDLVRSLLVASDGAVWIGSRRGATRWKDGGATIVTKAQGLGSDLVGPMLQDADGDIWIGTSGGLARLHAGAWRNYTTGDGLPGNIITSLKASAGGGLWVGTAQHGLAFWDGSRFFSFSGSTAMPRQIYGLLEDGAGSLWLTSDHGIFRIPIADLDRFRANPRSEIAVVPYGTADGLPTVETEGVGYPSAWKMNDGRICFATRRGVVIAEPSTSPASETAPPVELEQITVDDHSVTREQIASLAPGPSHFSFSFAGIHLAAPQRVQYRYMLNGVDKKWIDAGARRTAYYTSIPHGRYSFRVSARNAGGPWSQPVDLPLELRPHLYETIWFKLLLIVLFACLCLFLYRLRVRTLQSRFDAVSAERNRLAREIHDTLAQSFVAVSVRLEIMSQMLRSSNGIDACREQLNQIRSMVRDSLAEARRSIWDLRSEGVDSQSLPARLAGLVQETRSEISDTQLETTGTYRPLAQPMEDELYRIAQESVTNAVHHAQANALRLQLSYKLDSLSLRIVDDGRGFAIEQAPSREDGHFGLTGIQERARILGANVKLESEPGKGTSVNVDVPLAGDTKTRKEPT